MNVCLPHPMGLAGVEMDVPLKATVHWIYDQAPRLLIHRLTVHPLSLLAACCIPRALILTMKIDYIAFVPCVYFWC